MAIKAIALLVLTVITMLETHTALYFLIAKGPVSERARRWTLNSLLLHEAATLRGAHPTVWRVWPQLFLGGFVFAMTRETYPAEWALSLGVSCFAIAFISTSARAFLMNAYRLSPGKALQQT